ncbi:MAG TPA: helix-turn-helix domain-containing protein [Fulvivirga sp.]|nr:helix-turn-helix domain-containing protein [Fulvivirga sp.]
MDKLIQIIRVDRDYAQRIASSPAEPHNHDFEELLIGIEGSLEHFIDFQTNNIYAPYVSFVTKGKVHRVIPRDQDGKCLVWAIRFKSEFIADLTFHLYTLFHNSADLQLSKGRCFQRLVTMCELMNDELQQEQPDYSIIRHLLSALFMMIESEKEEHTPDFQNKETQSTTFTTFLRILEDNFRRPEGVEFYAEKLFMTSRNLNLICQKIIQQSVSEIIETRKLNEAKNLLAGTDKTISEIAYELGYNETSYFSNVFKRKSSQTPSEFRKEMRALV